MLDALAGRVGTGKSGRASKPGNGERGLLKPGPRAKVKLHCLLVSKCPVSHLVDFMGIPRLKCIFCSLVSFTYGLSTTSLSPKTTGKREQMRSFSYLCTPCNRLRSRSTSQPAPSTLRVTPRLPKLRQMYRPMGAQGVSRTSTIPSKATGWRRYGRRFSGA